MSYCRWSSDDFKSDVYVYEDVAGGFTTHVAGNRVVGEVPALPPFNNENIEEFMRAHQSQTEFMKTAEHVPIGLPHDGESFNDDTAEECANRLTKLRALGYYVPQYAIDALLEEAKS